MSSSKCVISVSQLSCPLCHKHHSSDVTCNNENSGAYVDLSLIFPGHRGIVKISTDFDGDQMFERLRSNPITNDSPIYNPFVDHPPKNDPQKGITLLKPEEDPAVPFRKPIGYKRARKFRQTYSRLIG